MRAAQPLILQATGHDWLFNETLNALLCCSFCAGICAPDTFPWRYCFVPGCPVLTAVSKSKMSLGSNCLWVCYHLPEALRWETVLHLHDCAHSSEAFWSQVICINGDGLCTSPAHAWTWATRKLNISPLSRACYNKLLTHQVLSVSRAQSKTP